MTMKLLPAEIKERSGWLRHCRPGTRPRQEVELRHIAEFARLNVTYGEVTDDKVITVDMWRQQHDLQRHKFRHSAVSASLMILSPAHHFHGFLPVKRLKMSEKKAKVDLVVHHLVRSTSNSILPGDVHRTTQYGGNLRWQLSSSLRLACDDNDNFSAKSQVSPFSLDSSSPFVPDLHIL